MVAMPEQPSPIVPPADERRPAGPQLSDPRARPAAAGAGPDALGGLDATDGIDSETFRLAFRQLAASVAVVTVVGRDGRPRGMTATSLCALAVVPPSLLVCIDRSSRTHRELGPETPFGVDILAAGQHRIAAWCARRGTDKVLPRRWLEPTDDAPHLSGALVKFTCRIEAIHPASTHDIVVGRIVAARIEPGDAQPLLYHDGAFGSLAAERLAFLAASIEADRD